MADEDQKATQELRKQLIEARRLVNSLSRVCRQTIAYLDGVSALDDKKLRRTLTDISRTADRFMND